MTSGTNKIPKIITIILVLILLIVVEGGCMKTREGYQNISESAINFLEEKYNREFTFCSYEGGDYLSKIDYIHCLTEGMDSEHERVTVTVKEEEGKTVFKDDYFSYMVRPELESYISNIISDEFPEVKVYVDNREDYLSNELTYKSTLDDLYRIESSYWADVKIYIKGDAQISTEEYAEKMQHIEDRLRESGHAYTIYMFAVSPEVYGSIGRYEQTDFWNYYATHRVPDGDQYYYSLQKNITGGES